MTQKIRLNIQSKIGLIRSIFIRYFFYAFALVESFALPKLIDQYNYSQYEYYKNFIFIFPYFLLGAHSGYVYLKYAFKVDYYKQLFSIGLIVTIFLSGVFSLIFQKNILLIPLIIIGVYTISEQYLKIRKRFTIIFLFKPLLSITTVIIAFYFTKFNLLSVNYDLLLFSSFGIAFIIWFLLCTKKNLTFPIINLTKIKLFTTYRYIFMVKVYFTGVLGSLLLSALIFFERYFTEKYYPESIATYSFAYNLSQIIVVLISAISYITSVELGERKDSIDKIKLKAQFIRAGASYIGFIILFTIFLYLISPFYSEFSNLITITLIITFAKGFFYLVGTISHLAVYHGYNTRMLKGLIIFSVFEFIFVAILIQLSISLPIILGLDSIVLMIYSFFILDIIFNRIQYNVN